MSTYILVINPGSTSTKVALFNQEQKKLEEQISHPKEDLLSCQTFDDHIQYRKPFILTFLEKNDCSFADLIAVVGRGGLLKPLPSGTYLVEQAILEDLRNERYQSHASNYGAVLAAEIAQAANVTAYIVDPVVVDELAPIARISGLKGIERRSIAHVLNQKAVARKILATKEKKYEEVNVIVAHLGGGISIGAHRQGQMIDVVNGLDGEGPFTTERSGSLPLYPFVKSVIEAELPLATVKKQIVGEGGLYSYLGETDLRKIEQINTEESRLLLEAMAYQISKAIGEMAVVLEGKVDEIILTGGMAHSSLLTQLIEQSICWIAPVVVEPGQIEMEALFQGVIRVLSGQEVVKRYSEV